MKLLSLFQLQLHLLFLFRPGTFLHYFSSLFHAFPYFSRPTLMLASLPNEPEGGEKWPEWGGGHLKIFKLRHKNFRQARQGSMTTNRKEHAKKKLYIYMYICIKRAKIGNLQNEANKKERNWLWRKWQSFLFFLPSFVLHFFIFFFGCRCPSCCSWKLHLSSSLSFLLGYLFTHFFSPFAIPSVAHTHTQKHTHTQPPTKENKNCMLAAVRLILCNLLSSDIWESFTVDNSATECTVRYGTVNMQEKKGSKIVNTLAFHLVFTTTVKLKVA